MQLDPSAAAAGVGLVVLGTVGSTNSEARLRAQRGERGPLWIVATEQSQGRGRMDRAWVSPQGNLYASLLLSDPSPFASAPELAFVAALALRDAVVAAAPGLGARLQFKWPNDLLLAGEKCAGILIEGETAPDGSVSIVIGIGLNCVSHPPTGPERPATDLKAHGAAVTPGDLLRELSAAMCRRLGQWDGGRNFAGIRSDWLAHAGGIGAALIVRSHGGERHGRFAGLDRSGRLILEFPDGGVEYVSAGDVFPLEQAGAQRAAGRTG